MRVWAWIVAAWWALTEFWKGAAMALSAIETDYPTLEIQPRAVPAPPLPELVAPDTLATFQALPRKVERWSDPEPELLYPMSPVVEDELGEWDPTAHRLMEAVLFRRVGAVLLATGRLHVPTSRASFIDWAMDRVLSPA